MSQFVSSPLKATGIHGSGRADVHSAQALVWLLGFFPFRDQNVLDKSCLITRPISQLVYFTWPAGQGNGPQKCF